MTVSIYASAGAFRKEFRQASVFSPDLTRRVRDILETVRERGDEAVLDFTRRFDGVERHSLAPAAGEWEQAGRVDPEIIDLCRRAASNIQRFHRREFEQEQSWDLTFGDARVGQQVTPLRRVGVYVPGGTAAYPSSVLMNVIPARVAGVEEIVLVSPPSRETGMINPLVLAAAELLGVEEVYAMGGAQAIAALAYGTDTIRPVVKITGPGNQYVNEAKRQVFGQVGIESLAGPSEILILADGSGDAGRLAADLLSQAEHDPQARSILVTTEQSLLDATRAELERQLETLPREEIARASLDAQGALVLVGDLAEGIDLVNDIAPEHLELQVEDPESALAHIRQAGCVFLGQYTPEPVGDYWAGSNHILPTAGAARYASALSVRDFLRRTSVVRYGPEQLRTDAEDVKRFARLEGLEAHARTIEYRLNKED